MLVEFQSVTEALRCAVDFQERMARRNRDMPAARTLLYRIGINLGDVIVENGDIFGDGANIAARLEAMAEPGGICISAAVRDQIGERLSVGYEDLGEQHVKNIARPIRAYKVLLNDTTVLRRNMSKQKSFLVLLRTDAQRFVRKRPADFSFRMRTRVPVPIPPRCFWVLTPPSRWAAISGAWFNRWKRAPVGRA